MTTMSDFSEDRLMKVFKELNVQLLNLKPNAIRAWFDTNDKDLKTLLNWMCTSLSEENYVSPLEKTQYLELRTSLTDEIIKQEKEQIEHEYPEIFDTEYNALEIEFLEEELNLVCQQEKELDESILQNRNLQKTLSTEVSKRVKEEIDISVKLKTAEENCLKTSEKLDSLNKQLYNKVVEYSEDLHNFEFDSLPTFLNDFDITVYQEQIENFDSVLQPVLDNFPTSGNITSILNTTNWEIVPLDDEIINKLNNMRNRILHSSLKYIGTTLEKEKLNAILAHLEKVTIDDFFLYKNSVNEEHIAVNLETIGTLCGMLEVNANKLADSHIQQTQIKHIERVKEIHQKNLHELAQLESMVQKLITHYLVMYTLFDSGKKNIGDFENFFNELITYANRDMESCEMRTEKMKETIAEGQNDISEGERKFAKIIVNSLSNKDKDYTIRRAYELICDFEKEIDFMETKFFSPSFSNIKDKETELRHSIKVLESFLKSGPTHRLLVIPTEFQIVIRKVEDILKKEAESVKTSMDTLSSTKKHLSKWQNYGRQLWMYFYADPDGLKFILQEVQKEFEMANKNLPN